MVIWIFWWGIVVAVVGTLALCYRTLRTASHYRAYARDLQDDADRETIARHSRRSLEMFRWERLCYIAIMGGVAMACIAAVM